EKKLGIPVHFTFFTVGEQVLQYPDIVKAETASGNSVGNHSLTHPQFASLTSAEARKELVLTSRAITSAAHIRTGLVREPYRGPNGSDIKDDLRFILTARQHGLVPISYNWDTKDYQLDAQGVLPEL